jgi:RNA-directed DNA polymerase
VKANHSEEKPAAVPCKAKQAGEVRLRWSWTEPSVWSDRMLTALEHGVKGGVWFSLIDKVYSKRNLLASFLKVKKNRGTAGVDHVTVEKFEKRVRENIDKLHDQLRDDEYTPQRIRRVEIPKLGGRGKRPLGIPTVRDRVVQMSLRHVLEPIFEKSFAACSYGFRPGRNCKDALREVDRLLKEGYHCVVDADIRSYFEMIDHDILMQEIAEQVSDGRIHRLIKSFLQQEILAEMRSWQPERGTPQGAVISPLLSNIYLNKLDHHMVSKGYKLVRYADDFVVLCKEEKEAKEALREIIRWMRQRKLELHEEKTRIADLRIVGEGFEFLGYYFTRSRRKQKLAHWPTTRSLKRIRSKLKPLTKRCNGNSLAEIIRLVNPLLKGWYEYYKHSPASFLEQMDGWMRMRLRSILRKRQGGRGIGRGRDHKRWPNAFFAENGLFSLLTARHEVCQPSCR